MRHCIENHDRTKQWGTYDRVYRSEPMIFCVQSADTWTIEMNASCPVTSSLVVCFKTSHGGPNSPVSLPIVARFVDEQVQVCWNFVRMMGTPQSVRIHSSGTTSMALRKYDRKDIWRQEPWAELQVRHDTRPRHRQVCARRKIAYSGEHKRQENETSYDVWTTNKCSERAYHESD